MSELVPIRGRDLEHGPAIPAALPVPAGVSSLRAWASSLADAVALAEALVDTPFVPDSYRPRLDPRASAEQVHAAREVAVATSAAAMMYGSNLGFDPMSALQNVYVVGGRPGLYAAAMVALVQAAGHQVWTEDVTATRAVVCGQRRGSGFVERVEVTIDAARRAGWTRNQKYTSEPEAMLWARAASKVCRRIAQDTLKGLGASVEEMLDGDDAPPAEARTVVARAVVPELVAPEAEEKPKPARAPRKKTAPAQASAPVSRRPEGEDGPPPLPGDDEPAAAEPALQLASAEQLAALKDAFAVRGLEAAAARRYAEQVVGHEVVSPARMTAAEADLVLAALAEAVAEGEPEPDAGEPVADDGQGALDVDGGDAP